MKNPVTQYAHPRGAWCEGGHYAAKKDILEKTTFLGDKIKVCKKHWQALQDKLLAGRNNPMKARKEALEYLKLYKGDVRAGHSKAADYWKGAASAAFTLNPTVHLRYKNYEWVTVCGASVGSGNPPTSDISKVTCKSCLKLATGTHPMQKRRNPHRGSMMSNTVGLLAIASLIGIYFWKRNQPVD